jgi:hypothetical protein
MFLSHVTSPFIRIGLLENLFFLLESLQAAAVFDLQV